MVAGLRDDARTRSIEGDLGWDAKLRERREIGWRGAVDVRAIRRGRVLLAQAPDAWDGIEPAIEAQDGIDAVLAHDRDVDGVTRREGPPAQELVPGMRDRVEIDRQHLIDDRQERIERRLDGVGSSNCPVSMQDLLQDLGVGDEQFTICDEPLEPLLRVDLVGVDRPDQVHRDVRVDEYHDVAE